MVLTIKMRDTDESCKWTVSINGKTKFDFLKYLFEFQIRTKSQSHIKSYISIEKHVQGEIIEIKIQNQKSI